MSELLAAVIEQLIERFGFAEVWRVVIGHLTPEQKLARAEALRTVAWLEEEAAERRANKVRLT